MIIICPNCETRYQVAEKAIGSAGRKVQCAHCQQAWQAFPVHEEERPKPKLVTPEMAAGAAAKMPERDADQIFDAQDEAALDDAFSNEEKKQRLASDAERDVEAISDYDEAAEGETGKTPSDAGDLDEALVDEKTSGLRKAMRRRQDELAAKLPLGRIRKQVRIAGLCALILFATIFYAFRTEIVRQIPDLAGVYSAIGLGVNVVGIKFRDVETLKTLRDGETVTIVSGRMQNISGRNVRVPPVVVSILSGEGEVLYSWSVAPAANSMGPGEVLDFETQLNAAPEGAQTVRVSLQDNRSK